jgi:hypothetical protein
MDRMLLQIDDKTHRLRRVGRLARHRMRLEGADLTDGIHTDGRVTITISGLGLAAAGVPDTFDWEADRPIALVIVRAGVDGDDVSFHIGPAQSGQSVSTLVGDGTGIRYIAFCYDAEPDPVAAAMPARQVAAVPVARPVAAAAHDDNRDDRAAAVSRPSLLERMLKGQTIRAGSAA